MTRVSPAISVALAAGLAACQTTGSPPSPPPAVPGLEFGRTDKVVVARVQPGDTAASLARRYLKDDSQGWRISSLSGGGFKAGEAVAIPLDPLDPGGRPGAAAKLVPILCYHRFSAGRSTSAMEVSADHFEAQLRWLAENGYTVTTLEALAEFAQGRRVLPAHSVVITIDDGYRSAYQTALPILRRYGAPATLFVYTDFVGSAAALTWPQLQEMAKSGLIDVQAHSKTHVDMVKRLRGESDAAYDRRVRVEIETPRNLMGDRLQKSVEAFAYPYGAADPHVIDETKRAGYRLGLTVARGGNPSWADAMLLRRDMVYGSDSLEMFVRRVRAAEQGGRSDGTEFAETEP